MSTPGVPTASNRVSVTRRSLASLSCLLLVVMMAPACRAQPDQAVLCYRSKVKVAKTGAMRLMRCAAKKSRRSPGDRRQRCVEKTERRVRALLGSADRRAAKKGFSCPGNAENMGLEGAATWPLDLVDETVAQDLTADLRCARRRLQSATGYVAAYAKCRIEEDQEDPAEARACASQNRSSFEDRWTAGAEEGCSAATAATEVADRIESEIEAAVLRLRVRCGDGRRDGFETCDDGGTQDGDGCSADCKAETCRRVGEDVHCLACPPDSEPDFDAGQCRCPDGFEGEPGACVDIDECNNSSALCPAGSPCVNVPGSYACAIDCSEEAFEQAIAACGPPTGHIVFDCRNAVIPVAEAGGTRPRRVDCDGLVIDGLDRNITFEMDPLCWRMPLDQSQCAVPLETDGTCECPDVDNGTTFLLLAGNADVVRNISVRGFFDGIRAQGVGGRVENVSLERMCDDAIGSVGAGVGNVFRDLQVSQGCDKCAQSVGDKALTDPDPRLDEHYNAIFSNIDFVGCATPLRMAQSGRFRIEDVRMSPDGSGSFRCDGPRFTGDAPGSLFIEMTHSAVMGCRRGVRLGHYAEAVLRDNEIRYCGLRGVWAAGNARVSMSSNDIRANGGEGSSEKGFGGVAVRDGARVDLGGGSLELDGNTVVSTAANSICDNYAPDGSRQDVENTTATPVSAQENWWCSEEPPTDRVTGAVDVIPFLQGPP